jgi:hypothetical protein
VGNSIRSHLVPAGYLRGFAADGHVMAIDRNGRSRRRGVKQAGVERDFYRRRRPDGTYIQDVEETMARLESDAIPVIRDLGNSWPPERTARATLAQFLALQLVRGRGWRGWHDEFIGREVESWQETREPVRPGGPAPSEADIEAVGDALLGDAGRLRKMLELVPKVATLLGHMHWTLLRFGRDRLATSDSPVVPWPLAEHTREPGPLPWSAGIREMVEVRFAVSPRLALLMTWLNEDDRTEPRVAAAHHDRNLNAFVMAQAEREWFHRPGMSVRQSSGRLTPLSAELFPDYSGEVVEGSLRRKHADQIIQPDLGETTNTVTVITGFDPTGAMGVERAA